MRSHIYRLTGLSFQALITSKTAKDKQINTGGMVCDGDGNCGDDDSGVSQYARRQWISNGELRATCLEFERTSVA